MTTIGTLYGYWRSSCSWRVRIALQYKGLSVKHHSVHLVKDGGAQFLPSYANLNPMHQVPALELLDGTILTQSIAILEYLEESYPSPPLLPEVPNHRAQVRQIVEIINSGIQPLQNLALLNYFSANNIDRLAFAKSSIEKGLQSIVEVLPNHTGPFLFGEMMTLADCCLIPQLYNAKRFNCNLEGLERLLMVEQHCQSLPFFQGAHPNRQQDAVVEK